METGALPEFVRMPDGTTEPFQPERITRAIFNAAERIGIADAFLARELTESILHFLAEADEGSTVSPEHIVEVAEKVVRELGHPTLARAFAEPATPIRRARLANADSPWPAWFDAADSGWTTRQRAASATLGDFSISRVYPPELVSAHHEGLLRLMGLAAPFELAGMTISIEPERIFETIRQSREVAGSFLAVDGPEYDLTARPGDPKELARKYLGEVRLASETLGLTAILNLNLSTPPPRFLQGEGPLFTAATNEQRERRQQIAAALSEMELGPSVRIRWHSAERPKESSFDWIQERARGPIPLGPGLDRQTPATLAQVGVNLVRLVEMIGQAPVSSELFMTKLASLTRFAKTAGHAKQDFLRKYGRPGIREAFLLDRSRLVLIPLGLDDVAACTERPPAEFAREIPRTMKLAAEQDRPRVMPVKIELPANGLLLPD